ncbi:hypothetical protein BD408DRAFT_407737 [Parasitella parasitica]|nr:hypothetical protein BD408DRAFT_407737 [Parasitella parasitica]
MELDLCLYCEKRLTDESIAFCSMSCQSNEASKSSSFIQLQHTTRNSALPKSYSMSYHRSPSLSYSISSSSTTISSSSRRTRKESLPALMSSSLSHHNSNNTRSPPFFLMQSLSTSSSFSSSLSDISVFSAPYSCEDKAPYHITRTTQNIAS